MHANRLAHEKSPYLLQHANNPVDWYPWGPEAFEKARRDEKPIFLSIGYSTCHWCHVMEHESFENEEVAGILNERFVPIKVDREERPDVDDIYMTALTQVLQQQGGWPMSIWLTPDLKPFFGGTYFPPEDMLGRPGFKTILLHVSTLWGEKRAEIEQDAQQITAALDLFNHMEIRGELSARSIEDAVDLFDRVFDDAHGGFGNAPKFPQPSYGLFLLRHHARTGSARSLEMVELQLEHMARGGIYDHLGGGFARYSTDEKWLVPHFEKMLYDNALLLRLYAEAYQLTGKQAYERIAREAAAYVLRDMTDPLGGFYSAEDADSEGREGKFYVWTADEVEAVLGAADARIFSAAYDVTPEGNWTDPHHDTSGLTILNQRFTTDQLAKLEHVDPSEVQRILDDSKKKLFYIRSKRPRPLRDDKILTAWNGLMISGLSIAARSLQEPSYAEAASKAAEFVRTHLYKDGRLLARYRDGEAKYEGTLADYAFFVQGLLDLYEAAFDGRWLKLAIELTTACIELFYDDDNNGGGGFFFSSKGRDDLIVRKKELSDGALPSGNSVATNNLVRLAELLSDGELRARAEATLRASAQLTAKYPREASYLLIALDHAIGPSREIVIAGDPQDAVTKEMVRAVQTRFLPRTVVLLASDGVEAGLLPMLEGKRSRDGAPAAYVCENFTCKQPATTVAALIEQLSR